MSKTVYIVEEWVTVGGDHDACEATYCFDTEHEAEAFRTHMKTVSRSDWYLEARVVFTHMQDAIAMIAEEEVAIAELRASLRSKKGKA